MIPKIATGRAIRQGSANTALAATADDTFHFIAAQHFFDAA
jgi:hypothetical protein